MKKRAVTAIILYGNKIVIGKKKIDSSKFLAGKWHIPGETVEKGESDTEALMRGAKQELGLEIRVGRYICSSTSPTSKRKVGWYECFSNTEKIVPSSDLEDAKWIYKRDILKHIDEEAINLWPKDVIKYFKIQPK